MEKQIKLANMHNCTGCRACSNVCPTSSIKFALKGLHYYPVVNEDTCIKCGKCMNACSLLQWQVKHPSDTLPKAIYYCAWNVDSRKRFSSTSGGVGSALAELALEKGWYVCGAAFDKEWNLAHIISNENSIIDAIKGSKYLQSNTEGIYKKIKELLLEDNRVIFFGTPCQTDALRNSIPTRLRENLILCEIICHGVNSPYVWQDYRKHLEEKFNSPLVRYNFRSKRKGWGKLRISYSFENGNEKDVPAYRNIFHTWFGLHYMMRESCFRCPYRTATRYSDIVIGDFWGIESIRPSLDVKNGASVVVTNTLKGDTFLGECDLKVTETDETATLKVIKGYIDNTSEERKKMEIERMHQFEKNYATHSFEEMYKKLYPMETLFQKISYSILFHLHLKK